MPRAAQNLSSSISLFIEDSRVSSPVPNNNSSNNNNYGNVSTNPPNFYTISAFTHTPNITTTLVSPSSPSSSSSSSFLHCVSGGGGGTGVDIQNQRHENLVIGGGGGHVRTCRSRQPREIIHKIRREGEDDDDETNNNNNSLTTTTSSSSTSTHFYSPSPSRESCSSSSGGSSETQGRSSSVGGGGRASRRVSLSLNPRTPWTTFPENKFLFTCTNQGNGKSTIGGSECQDRGRSFTSVNLTLKSPTSVQGSITQQLHDVNGGGVSVIASSSSSVAGGGCHSHHQFTNPPSLTYSSYSSDGYESQLSIQIGPHGGSISASRRRNSGNTNSNNSNNVNILQPTNSRLMHQMNADLLAIQKERKQKLVNALKSERFRLVQLRTEISSLRNRFQQIPDMERLKAINQKLRIECDLMARQVDLYDNGTVPLGETSEEFYGEINPGQDWGLSGQDFPPPSGFMIGKPANRRPPVRPPPPKILPLPSPKQTGEWTCSLCTFLNSEFLNRCEQCNMMRLGLNPGPGSPSPSRAEPRSLQYNRNSP